MNFLSRYIKILNVLAASAKNIEFILVFDGNICTTQTIERRWGNAANV